MTHTIISSYKQASDNNLLALIHRVTGKMEANPNFPDPPAALAALKTALPEYVIALNNASGRDLESVAIKNAQKAKVVDLLTQLAEYVSLNGAQDRGKLLSSGFTLSRGKASYTLGQVKDLQVTADRSGEATTRVRRVKGARAYVHRCTIEPVTPDSVWISKFVAEASYTHSGLQSKERYVFQVIAVGAQGLEQPSPSVTKVIQ